MQLTSSAFRDQGIIPSLYTCEGQNINPPLSWADMPPETKSFVLILDDSDVPKHVRPDGMWDHWILFNIPPNVHHITANWTPPTSLSGKTTWGNTLYGGPCPPDREHRYFFKLYALDTLLSLPVGSLKKEIEKAMAGHILAHAQLIGRYEKG